MKNNGKKLGKDQITQIRKEKGIEIRKEKREKHDPYPKPDSAKEIVDNTKKELQEELKPINIDK